MLGVSGSRVRAFRPVVISVVTAMVASFGVALAPAAHAADAGVSETVGTLQRLATWSQGLGGVGKLGQALPLLSTSPGAPLGFATALQESLYDELSTASTWGELGVNKDVTVSGARHGHLATSVEDTAAGKRLVVDLTLTGTLASEPLSFADSAGAVRFSASGGVKVDSTLHVQFAMDWVSDGGGSVYFERGASGPSILVDAHASLPTPASISASVGILGVTLDGTSTIDVEAHLAATVNDPNGDGRLYFDAPGGVVDDGELGAAGSLAGLVSLGLANPAGHATGHFVLHASAPPAGLSLPAVDATIDVSWPDIAAGTPNVTASGLSSVADFLSMSPLDMAQGLAQVVTALDGIQRRKLPSGGNVDLPFMKGTLADAVKLNETLKKFLEKWTYPSPNPADPAKAGQPKFDSVQDLLTHLGESLGVPGLSITVSNLDYQATKHKLAFTLALTHTAPASPVPLDPAGTLASGGGAGTTYGDQGLADSTQHWTADQWKGRRVVAGNVGGTVASNDENTITLDKPWSGPTPVAGSPYSINDSAAQAGSVSFADLLTNGTKQGVHDANAATAVATVTPSYAAHLTLVLDLQPAKTGNACSPDPCPYTMTNPDGSKTIVDQQPLGVDRLLIRTTGAGDLLTASLPIHTAVDLFANAGFFEVRLQGSLDVCAHTSGPGCSGTAGTDPMVSIKWKSNLGDADGDLSMADLFTKLVQDPASLVDYQTHIDAQADVTASVPDAASFLPAGSGGISATWDDIGSGSTPTIDTSHITELFKLDFSPDDPHAYFTVVLKVLQKLAEQIDSLDPDPAFDTKIPVLGKSFRDLLRSTDSGGGPGVTYTTTTLVDTARNGHDFPAALAGRSVVSGTQINVVKTASGNTLTFTDPWTTLPAPGTPYTFRTELDDAISLMQTFPPDSMQRLVSMLKSRLGNNSLVTLDYQVDGTTPTVVVGVDWKRAYRINSPVRFDFNTTDTGDRSIVGAQGKGSISLGVTGELAMNVVVPLVAPTTGSLPDIRILDTSHASIGVDGGFSGTVQGNIGPLSVSLGDPTSGASDLAEAQGNYKLSLKDPAADAAHPQPEDFGDFASALTFGLDDTVAPVTCSGVDSGSAKLSLCAHLPVYVSANGTTWSTATGGTDNAFIVRLPRTDDFADAFDFGGADLDTHPRLETPDPAALLAALQAAILDFSKLGEGFDGYLALLQQGLQTASAGGKLPLVGQDLQEGADFIGKLRKTLDEQIWSQLPSNGRIPDVAGIQTWLNTKLKTALTDAGVNPAAFTFSFVCTTKLAPVDPAPTVTPDATGGGTHWEYAVAAVTGSGVTAKDSTLSPVGSTGVGPATIDGTHGITVAWTASSYADGYRVVRRASGGDPWKLVSGSAPLDDDAASFDDKTLIADATAYTTASADPQLASCDHAGIPLTDISGVQIKVTIGQGTVSTTDGCVAASGCLSKTLPLDIGIPGLALRADQTSDAGNGVKIDLAWQVHLAFGLDREHGFFVKTKDEVGPELGLGLAVRMPTPGPDGAQLKAQLAILNVSIKNAGGAAHADDSLFHGAFGIDIRADASNTGEYLTLASIQDANSLTDLVHPVLTAGVSIDWTIDADIDQALPGVHVEHFLIAWSWSNDAPGSNASGLTIAFNGVAINAGSFFTNLLGPVLKQLKTVTGPLQPVIDTLYAPIPVLSDLSHLAGGDDVTLITLAKTFSTLAGGPKLDFIDRVAAIITLVNSLPVGANIMIPVGDFTVVGADALSTPNTPDSGANLIGTTTPNNDLAKNLNQNSGKADPVLSTSTDTATPDKTTLAGKAGFSFPIVQKPTSVFKLLMGQDIDLVTFDSGPLTLGFDWRQSFGPIYAPPPVMLTLSGSASVTAHIVAGFDTFGIRKLVEQIQDGTATPAQGVADVLSGLYFRTTDDDGKPIPVVTFYGEIAAGAAVSAVIIEVGLEGGLSLTINFNWRDPNNDGKFRISEFLATALSNPLCLFTVNGRIALFVRVYITIGFSPFSVTFSFTLADITLLDFSVQADCTPPPPKLGGVSADGTLYLFAGKLGGPTYRGSPWDNPDGDQFKVTQLHDFPDGGGATYRGVAVDALGEHWEFLNDKVGEIKRVVVDANGYAKDMKVTFTGDGDKSKTDPAPGSPKPKTTPFDLPVYYAGGNGVDTLRTGQGVSVVDGAGGDDVITTADDPGIVPGAHAVVAGGLGADNVSVGGGDDTVAGDSGLGYPTKSVSVQTPNTKGAFTDAYPGSTTVNALDWSVFDSAAPSSSSGGTDGGDHLSVGLGKNKVYGNGGDDSVGVAADSPQAKLPGNAGKPQFVSQGNTIVGGDGKDQIASGSGNDTIYTADEAATAEDGAGSDDAGTGVSNTVDTGTGNDTVYGGTAPDFVTGHSLPSQHDAVYGGAGQDVLAGGYGPDQIFGGPDDDWVIAEPSTITGVVGGDPFGGVFGPYRTVTHLPLPTGVTPAHKLLVGGDDKDHIVGGDGGADVFGDRHRDACALGSDPESTPPAETADAVGEHAGRDLILGGEGVDVVAAGGADDRVEAFGGDDRACGQAGDDVLLAGAANDVAYGGSGKDVAYGDAGSDRVYGNDDDDVLYGNQGTDILEGNNGSDIEFGGTESDLVVGGTRKAAATDTGGDTLYGDDGADTLIGDNGTGGTLGDSTDPARPFDLSGSPATAGAADLIYGGVGDDLGFGGLGGDTMFGGSEADHFEGNNGSDAVNGDDGEDEIVGGSFEVAVPGVLPTGRPDSGDVLSGGSGPDIVVGDNAVVSRVATGGSLLLGGRGFTNLHSITLLDLGFTPAAGTSGDDLMSGDGGNDVMLGQSGQDRMKGGANDDYTEGGPGQDWIEGNDGDDDVVGGSSTVFQGSGADTSGQPDSADALWGGGGDDVVSGDNGVILRTVPFTKATDRLGTTSAGNRMARRQVVAYDLRNNGTNLLGAPTADRYGADQESGGQGVDVLYGQDGADALSGGGNDDYLEGNGGVDLLRGDAALTGAGHTGAVPALVPSSPWPGAASSGAGLDGPAAADGQDDEIGGSSTPAFRDGADVVEGNGAADVQLGDNGSLVRTLSGSPGSITEAVYAKRYPAAAVPADATRSRTHDPAAPGPSTRFCQQPAASATCDVAGAFGADTMYGDGGDDGMWGQDGADVMRGGDGRDDMYGELGDDQMFGEAGDDAMVGDRGGIANFWLDGTDDPGTPFTVDNGGVPKETYKGLQAGSYDRRVDLLHDVDGAAFVGAGATAPMAHAGLKEGGNDQLRGGSGADNIHAAFGDDLANGDSGGDQVFGGDGADVLWGGKGCDPVLDAAAPDCLTGGVFDPTDRGNGDRMIDHVFGGVGATSGPSIAGAVGSDLLDFNPRGTFATCTNNPWPTTAGSGTTLDPCAWFVMTDKNDADVTNNQHHQGTDWLYGGWDRDVLQGDVAQNGPNPGDRLLDWNGAYNLYTHCNSAYGGYNDVRQHSPSMQDFLQKLAWGTGAGQSVGDVTTTGTSAFRELAVVIPGADNAHGSGSAFPSTPGHFDDPASCSD